MPFLALDYMMSRFHVMDYYYVCCEHGCLSCVFSLSLLPFCESRSLCNVVPPKRMKPLQGKASEDGNGLAKVAPIVVSEETTIVSEESATGGATGFETRWGGVNLPSSCPPGPFERYAALQRDIMEAKAKPR